MDGPGEGRLVVALYLKRTFEIPLDRVAAVAGWQGFEDGDGATTDDDLERLLGELLRAPR